MSIVIGQKTLFLMEVDNSDSPIELAFQPRYGEIVAYKWYEIIHMDICMYVIS